MRGARNGLAEGLVIKPMYVLAKLKELGNGQRLHVELTGAARLYRAASSDRRERG
jgi:hypothetical protein